MTSKITEIGFKRITEFMVQNNICKHPMYGFWISNCERSFLVERMHNDTDFYFNLFPKRNSYEAIVLTLACEFRFKARDHHEFNSHIDNYRLRMDCDKCLSQSPMHNRCLCDCYESPTEECPICLNQIQLHHLHKLINCTHRFCKGCLDHIEYKGRREEKCPLCRASMFPVESDDEGEVDEIDG